MPTRPGARLAPIATGPEPGEVQALDFVVTGDFLHLIWLYRIGDRHSSYVKSKDVWYSRCDLKTGSWTKPLIVASEADVPPRIEVAGDSIHVLVPHNLRHLVSGDSGATWVESTPLLHPGGYIATNPEVIADGDSLMVSYLTRERRGDFELGAEALFVAVWGHGRLGSSQILYKANGMPGIEPRPYLAVSGGARHAFLAITHHLPSYGTGTLCHWSSSSSGGYRWSLPDSSEWPDEVYRPARESAVYEYAATVVGDTNVVFAAKGKLHVVTWSANAPERVSQSVAAVPDRYFSAYLQTSSTEPAVQGRGGQVVWIDTRYGRTDKTPLNPLGGIPWSDAPDWGNNDVFALPMEAVLHGGSRGRNLKPLRLTRDLSYTQCVRARATAREVIVVWAGWPRYKRDGSHMDVPPSIWFTTLPLHP
jgi:hypothetical protein